jgi:hypothetical protein
LSDYVRDPRDLIDAHEDVHLRQESRQLLAKPLGQTAGHNQALTAVLRFTQFRRLKNGINALLLG